jgi:CheY-like chemotaxis protein
MIRRLSATPVAQQSAPSAPAAAAAARMARPGVMGVTDFGGLDELPTPAAPAASTSRFSRSRRSGEERGEPSVPEVIRGDVLLVAESLVEGRILHKRFKKYNLAIDWSRDAKQALAMLKAHAYRLVVIDRLGGEPDANAVCRAAKQRKMPNGQSPVVMMFAPSAGSMDRIKAGLAGSDAYLSRSVAESDLYKVLAQHRLVDLDGFEQTNLGGF